MAKIYETTQDVDRDHARDQLRDAQVRKHHDFDNTLAAALVATASRTAEELHQLQAKTSRTPASKLYTGFNKVLMWAGLVTGAISLIGWMKARSDESHAKGQIQALGPEEIKYPPLAPGEFASAVQEGQHCGRLKEEVASTPCRKL